VTLADVPNHIDGVASPPGSGEWLEKLRPTDGSGSEPHMGFGGVKQSGTGWREAGVEALDVYSEWKYVNLISDPAQA
jgi:hypothetical protein